MSEQLSFDRNKGFVALPVEVLDLDLTPGAFRTLVELCRMANDDGFCWPSLDQLSQKLGRSKAAISGYLKDLRGTGLIATQEQRTANGYNYRLKYLVTFWSDWRAALRRKPRKKDECSVQPDERLEESKNNIHKNQTSPAAEKALDKILSGWSRCFSGAPYPAANRPPSENLQRQTADVVTRPLPDIAADISPRLQALWSVLRLSGDGAGIGAQAQQLSEAGLSEAEFCALCVHLRRHWPVHWRQIPTPEQFAQRVAAAKITPLARKVQVLKGYQRRWALAEKALQKPSASCSLGQTAVAWRAVE